MISEFREPSSRSIYPFSNKFYTYHMNSNFHSSSRQAMFYKMIHFKTDRYIFGRGTKNRLKSYILKMHSVNFSRDIH